MYVMLSVQSGIRMESGFGFILGRPFAAAVAFVGAVTEALSQPLARVLEGLVILELPLCLRGRKGWRVGVLQGVMG